jgi:UDP-N-acetylmuramoylalanine--D-glutamate ligase
MKRIAVIGSGESGTGAALLAKAKGYDVFVSDNGTLKEKYKKELVLEGIAFEEGGHSTDKILTANAVIKSPGVPEKADIIKKVREAGIPVIDEIEFAWNERGRGKVIAITGTNGKTTTTLLTYHLLKSAGFRVALAGNVGESFARKVLSGPHDWYVLEISSFQLDGTFKFHPEVGILLNITPDHLDRYEYKMENYIHSKFRLTANMNDKDFFIYYSDDPVVGSEVRKRKIRATPLAVSFSDARGAAYASGSLMTFNVKGKEFTLDQAETTLKGKHNLINTMSAVTAALLAGVVESDIRESLRNFRNAPHRLEPVATLNGVDFVNDSKATNVDSVVYALGSFDRPLVWIAGGLDKGNDYNLIKDLVKQRVKALVCLGKDNAKLRSSFSGTLKNIFETNKVEEAVDLALKSSDPGDVVLLSPACASFDLFKNYEDRGEQFKKAVLEKKKKLEAV